MIFYYRKNFLFESEKFKLSKYILTYIGIRSRHTFDWKNGEKQ